MFLTVQLLWLAQQHVGRILIDYVSLHLLAVRSFQSAWGCRRWSDVQYILIQSEPVQTSRGVEIPDCAEQTTGSVQCISHLFCASDVKKVTVNINGIHIKSRFSLIGVHITLQIVNQEAVQNL